MGQQFGKAHYVESAQPYVNLDKKCIFDFWEAFNDVAEGFGINVEEFTEISMVMQKALNHCSKQTILKVSEAMFVVLDTDDNMFIDALESLATIALVSGMTAEDKAQFMFTIYDFDESNRITLDEMTLLLKSVVIGLCKVSTRIPPEEAMIELLSLDAFRKTGKNEDSRLNRDEFVAYVSQNPEIISWLNFYDDGNDYGCEDGHMNDEDSDLEEECASEALTDAACVATDPEFMELHPKVQKEQNDWKTRSWLATIENTIPSNPPPVDLRQPDENPLKLEWIHGYSSQNQRGNLTYTITGEVLYTAAAAGVVLNPETNEQAFCLDHSNSIVSLALHPNGSLAATGEVGRKPKIHIWNTTSMRIVATLTGFHRKAIHNLSFSPNGIYLASVGQDEYHSVAVYNWKEKRLLFAKKSTRSKVFDCHFCSDSTFVTCGVNHIYFWECERAGVYSKKKGLFGKLGKMQTMTCIASLEDGRVVTGSLSGHIYTWAGRNCQKSLKAHDTTINAFYSCSHGLLSGGKDGKVRLWTQKMEPGATFDMSGVGAFNSCVRAVCWSEDGEKLLVGTLGSEIYEISAEDGSNIHSGPIVQGHCRFQLHGLDKHPMRAEYCTVGDDQTVRVWDIVTRRMLRMVRLDTVARACAYSPDGQRIVVGLGGKVASKKLGHQKKTGAFVVLNEADLTIIHEARDSKRWISDVKFSPDGLTLAVGSNDNAIYLYNVDDFASKGKCKGHKGPLTNIDFSADNQCIQTNSANNELLFWNANTGEQFKHPSTMKDIEWWTQTCVLGWTVQGVWPAKYDGTEVLTVDKSYSGDVLASGDNFGRVRLTRYPPACKDANYNECRGHCSPVAKARFSSDDKHLVTIGRDDRCIFQWRHEFEHEEDEAEEFRNEPDSEDEADLADGTMLDRSDAQENANADIAEAKDEDEEEEGLVVAAPWVGSVVPPSAPPHEDPSIPNEGMSLEWVHGYNAQGVRGTLKYLPNGEIAYTAANLGVVLNKEGGGIQRFFTDHTDKAISMAIHPSGTLIATGQLGKHPKIIIWNAETMESVQTLQGFHQRGVPYLHFSKDGTRLASVGQDENHSIAVYDWENGTIQASARGDRKKVLAVDFTPEGSSLVQVGVNHIKFHKLEGRNFVTRKGILGKKGRVQALLCIGWLGRKPIVGTADGHLYGFEGNILKQAVKGHHGNVNTIYSCGEGIVSGGKDGIVKVWSHALEVKAEFDISKLGSSVSPRVRSVCWNPTDNKILVGTRASEIYEISGSDGSDINSGPLVCGHFNHELWGLAVHPHKAEFCTVGDDQTVRIWDIVSRKMLRMKRLDTMARSCAYSPDGTKIAVGLGARVGRGRQKKDGAFVVLNEKDLVVLHEGRNSKQWISDVKFSPDGNTLGLGSNDNLLYLYDIGGGYTLKGTCNAHNSYITHFDFSADGQYVQSNCGAYELNFCDGNSGEHIPQISTLKDVHWDSWTCPMGWPVQGVWPINKDGTDITAVHRSRSNALVASADNFGRIRLFRYPCLTQGAGNKTFRGHTSSVNNLRFSADDGYLITVGGSDRCIFQWKVEDAIEDIAIKAGDSGKDSDIDGECIFDLHSGKKEEFVAVKPWVGSIVAPTNAAEDVATAPDIDLELDFVHGYRSQDVRNNLRYTSTGEMVYFTASIGVVYSKKHHSQIFYTGHDDDIISMAIHPSGKYVATGQVGRAPLVHVWNAMTGQLVKKLRAFHEIAITSLCFSDDGNQLVSVGLDDNHAIAVWRTDSGTWADGYLQSNELGGQQKVLFTLFLGTHGGGDYQLVTGGVDHVKFWKVKGRALKPTLGLFGKKGKIQPIVCAASVGPKVVTGTVTGHLYVWSGNEIVKAIKAHEQTVNALHACHSGLISGSKDGIVKMWDRKLAPTRAFDMTEAIPTPFRPAIRSVCWDDTRGVILVGTQGSEIYEITVDNRNMLLVNEGHCVDQLFGLTMHPTNPSLFATCGDDKTVRVWDIAKRRMVRKSNVGSMTRAIAWSPDGEFIGIGLVRIFYFLLSFYRFTFVTFFFNREEARERDETKRTAECLF